MTRREMLCYGLMGAAIGLAPKSWGGKPLGSVHPPFELDEVTISELQEGMASGKFTSRSLTRLYLDRIDAIDRQEPALHAVIEINPDALAMADALDAERKTQGPRGPLHGIPILLKDNIGTADKMTTTAGSFALEGCITPRDSFVARKLREAGAVLLGKANLSEWANFRSKKSISGWSGRGGQCKCPYILSDNPSGSSSGSAVAVAANMCAAAIGTETDGSIISPANSNSIVGLKPTVGLISRSMIVPISHRQDTAGPMTRTVRDAALLLGVLTGEDPKDKTTRESRGKSHTDYTRFLDANGLKGAKIGVVAQEEENPLFLEAVKVLKDRGAVLIDPLHLDNSDPSEFEMLEFEFKADLNAYLKGLGSHAAVHTMAEVIEFNERHKEVEMPLFEQEIMVEAQAKKSLRSKRYRELLDHWKTNKSKTLDDAFEKDRLDALVGIGTSLSAFAGYPLLTVPAGYVSGRRPFGLTFSGRAYSEPMLLKLAYAYEQATHHRRPPQFHPNFEGEG